MSVRITTKRLLFRILLLSTGAYLELPLLSPDRYGSWMVGKPSEEAERFPGHAPL
jgi:hypothetical protein